MFEHFTGKDRVVDRSKVKAALGLFVALSLIFSLSSAAASVMESTNYQIELDSINFAGGRSTSSNWILESSLGELSTGLGTSTNYSLRAGYQQMADEVFLSLTGTAAVIMSPDLPGITGGQSNGSTTVNVVTNNTAGYQLLIASETDPSLQKPPDAIDDYLPASANPDFAFTTASDQAHLGFSIFGDHAADRFRHDGSNNCNAGSTNSLLACWDGLATSSRLIAEGNSSNLPDGTNTTINFRVEFGGGVVIPAGSYVATTTVTALPL